MDYLPAMYAPVAPAGLDQNARTKRHREGNAGRGGANAHGTRQHAKRRSGSGANATAYHAKKARTSRRAGFDEQAIRARHRSLVEDRIRAERLEEQLMVQAVENATPEYRDRAMTREWNNEVQRIRSGRNLVLQQAAREQADIQAGNAAIARQIGVVGNVGEERRQNTIFANEVVFQARQHLLNTVDRNEGLWRSFGGDVLQNLRDANQGIRDRPDRYIRNSMGNAVHVAERIAARMNELHRRNEEDALGHPHDQRYQDIIRRSRESLRQAEHALDVVRRHKGQLDHFVAYDADLRSRGNAEVDRYQAMRREQGQRVDMQRDVINRGDQMAATLLYINADPESGLEDAQRVGPYIATQRAERPNARPQISVDMQMLQQAAGSGSPSAMPTTLVGRLRQRHREIARVEDAERAHARGTYQRGSSTTSTGRLEPGGSAGSTADGGAPRRNINPQQQQAEVRRLQGAIQQREDAHNVWARSVRADNLSQPPGERQSEAELRRTIRDNRNLVDRSNQASAQRIQQLLTGGAYGSNRAQTQARQRRDMKSGVGGAAAATGIASATSRAPAEAAAAGAGGGGDGDDDDDDDDDADGEGDDDDGTYGPGGATGWNKLLANDAAGDADPVRGGAAAGIAADMVVAGASVGAADAAARAGADEPRSADFDTPSAAQLETYQRGRAAQDAINMDNPADKLAEPFLETRDVNTMSAAGTTKEDRAALTTHIPGTLGFVPKYLGPAPSGKLRGDVYFNEPEYLDIQPPDPGNMDTEPTTTVSAGVKKLVRKAMVSGATNKEPFYARYSTGASVGYRL